jgi:hypothetical protein
MRARLLVLAGLLGACDPYDPRLGDKPFLCGLEAPRCPDGYTPVDLNPSRCECQLHPPEPDAGATYACVADPDERNETPGQATPTRLDLNPIDSFNVSVCPADDVDLYEIPVAQASSIIILTVTYDSGRRLPDLDLLDRGGVSLHPTIETPSAMQIKTSYLAPSVGRYYARVAANRVAPEAVNYTLTLELVAPR